MYIFILHVHLYTSESSVILYTCTFFQQHCIFTFSHILNITVLEFIALFIFGQQSYLSYPFVKVSLSKQSEIRIERTTSHHIILFLKKIKNCIHHKSEYIFTNKSKQVCRCLWQELLISVSHLSPLLADIYSRNEPNFKVKQCIIHEVTISWNIKTLFQRQIIFLNDLYYYSPMLFLDNWSWIFNFYCIVY